MKYTSVYNFDKTVQLQPSMNSVCEKALNHCWLITVGLVNLFIIIIWYFGRTLKPKPKHSFLFFTQYISDSPINPGKNESRSYCVFSHHHCVVH